jgi:hypothetical protein
LETVDGQRQHFDDAADAQFAAAQQHQILTRVRQTALL